MSRLWGDVGGDSDAVVGTPDAVRATVSGEEDRAEWLAAPDGEFWGPIEDGDDARGRLRSGTDRSAPLGPDGSPLRHLLDRLRARLERARLDPGMPGARALIAVGALAALAAGYFLWSSRPEPDALPEPAASSYTAAASLSDTPRPEVSTSAVPVVVQVIGKVHRPGVVSLPPGSRVTDAITAAGGLKSNAGTGGLNLARKVVDGEQIAVGVRGTPAAAQPGQPAPAGSTASLDLNAATLQELLTLPGVGPVYAQRIVDYRTQHGGFRTVDELRQISGIGERRFAQLKSLVHV